METFDSLNDIQAAYDRLVELQKELQEQLFDVPETDWEQVEDRVNEENQIIAAIERAETLDERFREERSEAFRDRIETFADLHEKISEEINERKSEFGRELESVDQSMDLLDEYSQRSGSSYHLDETI